MLFDLSTMYGTVRVYWREFTERSIVSFSLSLFFSCSRGDHFQYLTTRWLSRISDWFTDASSFTSLVPDDAIDVFFLHVILSICRSIKTSFLKGKKTMIRLFLFDDDDERVYFSNQRKIFVWSSTVIIISDISHGVHFLLNWFDRYSNSVSTNIIKFS